MISIEQCKGIENIYRVSTDGGTRIYSQACQLLKLNHHHIRYVYQKSIIDRRTIQYINDRSERFDDYCSCTKKIAN